MSQSPTRSRVAALLLVALVLGATPVPPALAGNLPHCAPGQVPELGEYRDVNTDRNVSTDPYDFLWGPPRGFDSDRVTRLQEVVGSTLGEPTECLHDAGGVNVQATTRGTLLYRKDELVIFSDGRQNWAVSARPIWLVEGEEGIRIGYQEIEPLTWQGPSHSPPGWPAVTVASSPPPPARSQPPARSETKPLRIDGRAAASWQSLLRVAPWYEEDASASGVTIRVGPLPKSVGGRFYTGSNTLTLNEVLLRESHEVQAAVLAHELTHAQQVAEGRGDRRDCVQMEVEAYINGAAVWESFWNGYGPEDTSWERDQNDLLQLLSTEGEPGIYKRVVDSGGYQQQCDLWVP